MPPSSGHLQVRTPDMRRELVIARYAMRRMMNVALHCVLITNIAVQWRIPAQLLSVKTRRPSSTSVKKLKKHVDQEAPTVVTKKVVLVWGAYRVCRCTVPCQSRRAGSVRPEDNEMEVKR